MFSSNNLELFSKWYSIMPNKISDRFQYIYISNINNLYELSLLSNVFNNPKLILNSLLFDMTHISKSSYMFDLIVISDVCNNLSNNLLDDFKQNILSEQGEIWIICDNLKFENLNKKDYVINNILKNSIYRHSTIQFNKMFSLIVLR